MGVSTETQEQIVSQYHSHSDIYQERWSQLETIRDRFESTSREGRILYLKLSYINSVISIRTPVSRHEKALKRLMSGEDLRSVLEFVSYNHRKYNHIQNSLESGDVWEAIASDLEDGAVDSAHKTALDDLKSIGTVKAPFLLANIGYTQKMCIDANLARVFNLDRTPHMKDVESYEELCKEIYNKFPSLRDELDPYHLQWVIFDWHRHRGTETDKEWKVVDTSKHVTRHEAWFNAALSDVSEIKSVIQPLERS